ncbi:hypothetical protein, partial [Brucella tritici]|uniref:hypothetical protein n=1 Tax=Brucella tritici TaxID=94626 RepID=UPI001AED937D
MIPFAFHASFSSPYRHAKTESIMFHMVGLRTRFTARMTTSHEGVVTLSFSDRKGPWLVDIQAKQAAI